MIWKNSSLKETIRGELSRIPGALINYFATLTLGQQVYLPVSIATLLLTMLLRMKGWRGKLSQEKILEEIQDEIIRLGIEMERCRREEQTLMKAWEIASEDSRFRIENELRAERDRMRILEERIVYLETLHSSLKTIEALSYKYGKQVDKIYGEIIKVAKKLERGDIKDTNIEKILKEFMKLRDKSPEFPYIIKEIIKDKLSE
mgnify:CR=1 FL=1